MLKRLKAYLTRIFHKHDWKMVGCSWVSALPYRVETSPYQYEYYTVLEAANEVYECKICGVSDYSEKRARNGHEPHGKLAEFHHKRYTIKRPTAPVKPEGEQTPMATF